MLYRLEEDEEFEVGETVIFYDPTQEFFPYKCKVLAMRGQAIKLKPVAGEEIEWEEVITLKDMVSKYEEH